MSKVVAGGLGRDAERIHEGLARIQRALKMGIALITPLQSLMAIHLRFSSEHCNGAPGFRRTQSTEENARSQRIAMIIAAVKGYGMKSR